MIKTPAQADAPANPGAELERLLVETLLSQEALRQHRLGAIARRELAPEAKWLRRLSQEYLEKEPGGAPPQLSAQTARAYALYYLPVNFEKVCRLLLLIRPNLPGGRLRVLDFGCGPGTGSLAAASVFSDELAVTGCDQSAAMLELAAKLFGRWPAAARATFTPCRQPAAGRSFDLIIAANVLSELPPDRLESQLADFYARLDRRGVLLLLEPGQPAPTRALMAVRDRLLERHADWAPLYPCTHRSPCPMLAESKRDWCHGTLAWEPPSLVRILDELTGFNKHRLKFSALILQKEAAPPPGFRVVEISRGGAGLRLQLCGAPGFLQVSAKACGLRSAQHYDLVEVQRPLTPPPARSP